MNITLSVDDHVVRTVRKIAIDKTTTLTAMVRSYLESLAERDRLAREQAVAKFDATVRRRVAPWGHVTGRARTCMSDRHCVEVLSEDLNAGQRCGGVVVSNPFATV